MHPPTQCTPSARAHAHPTRLPYPPRSRTHTPHPPLFRPRRHSLSPQLNRVPPGDGRVSCAPLLRPVRPDTEVGSSSRATAPLPPAAAASSLPSSFFLLLLLLLLLSCLGLSASLSYSASASFGTLSSYGSSSGPLSEPATVPVCFFASVDITAGLSSTCLAGEAGGCGEGGGGEGGGGEGGAGEGGGGEGGGGEGGGGDSLGGGGEGGGSEGGGGLLRMGGPGAGGLLTFRVARGDGDGSAVRRMRTAGEAAPTADPDVFTTAPLSPPCTLMVCSAQPAYTAMKQSAETMSACRQVRESMSGPERRASGEGGSSCSAKMKLIVMGPLG